jgi:hypothetical protein
VGYENSTVAKSVAVNDNGEIVVVGQTISENNVDIFVTKLNDQGESIWQYSFGSNEDDIG